MTSHLRNVAGLLGAAIFVAGCAGGGREGPPAPVVSVSSPRPTTAPEVQPNALPDRERTQLPARSSAASKQGVQVYAYREPGAEPEPEPEPEGKPGSSAVAPEATPPEQKTAARVNASAASAPKPAQPTQPAEKPAARVKPEVQTTSTKPAPAKEASQTPPKAESAARVAPATADARKVPVKTPARAPSETPAPPKASSQVALAKPPAEPREQTSVSTRDQGPTHGGAQPQGSAPVAPTPAAKPPPAPAEKPATPALPPAADTLARQAEQQRQAGDYSGAAATLERSLRISPREAYLWNRLARVRMEQGLAAQAGQLAMRSNDLAGSQSTVKKDNWRIIAESRRRAGDAAGAGEAERRANAN